MQKLNSPYLTVIVPAYNVEKYIRQCLDSLIFQTEKNHRIVVVNDGSTDRTPEILQQYAREYPDFLEVIHQENKGLGAARNVGLLHVNTPFVTFLDSDDWQDPQFVEKVRILLERQEELPDIVFTLPTIYDDRAKIITPWMDKDLLNCIFFHNTMRCGDSDVVNVRENRSIYALEANTNRRIYRTEFLHRIDFSFTVGRKWEDVAPHFHAVHHAERCIAIQDTGFSYRVNTGGQITAGGGASRLDVVPVFDEALERAKEEQWTDFEIAYIIRMMMDFCKWSVEVTNADYILPLLSDLHDFFKKIPSRYFKIYLKVCPLSYKLDWLFYKTIRSPFYGIMKDYRTRELAVAAYQKLKCILRSN